MFARRLTVDGITVEPITHEEIATPCPVAWLDNFCMRNFTNDAVFDDTLPIADGLVEAGHRVPLHLLQERMEDWFRRKTYLTKEERLRIAEPLAGSISEPAL